MRLEESDLNTQDITLVITSVTQRKEVTLVGAVLWGIFRKEEDLMAVVSLLEAV